jgi:glycerophosphoryl diester phosphodiesterase
MRLSLLSALDSLIAPPPLAKRVEFLARQPFAHRGLHGDGVIENGRVAFSGAVALGHGIELDVQAARDGEAFVFHDATLERLTGESGNFADRSGSELDRILLKGTNESIPRLPEILALVGGRAPILIEVKAPGVLVGVLCLSVRRALEGYRGEVAIMSFNPSVGRWFRHHAPRYVRGLVVTEQEEKGWSGALRGRAKRHFSLWQAQPDFLAYDIRDLPSAFAAQQRARGLKVLTWTVRTEEQEQVAFAHADEVIYEKPSQKAG